MTATYRLEELWRAMRRHYPKQAGTGKLLDQGAFSMLQRALEKPAAERFVRPTARRWSAQVDGWLFPLDRQRRREAMLALTYRGLVNLKSPFELALYPRLIWELQPRTIIELGSFQGGSGLWLADQASALCARPCAVHSFDLHHRCVSRRARHPRLHFHRADLSDPDSIDVEWLAKLHHPWLVIDDAHTSVLNVFLVFDRLARRGDYYVIEDVFISVNAEVVAAGRIIEDLGWRVDTHYTDAFGYNVTCAPNGWLRKS
ncbi:MAG: hypothetical protein JXR83_03260 [Deltaproteobacteria bacterium]|nr:hypothetical protein [Deltaproteobacteria bacterium]